MRFDFKIKGFIEQGIEPNKLAVIGEDFELSWTQFEKRVNELCAFFRTNSYVRLEFPVIIYGHKSANMMVAIYAMMKLQIPYIPIDIIYPKNRLIKVKEVSRSQLIINTSAELLNIDSTNEIILGQSEITIQNKLESLSQSELKDDPLVYIIFTSGSTGEPKGVQISTVAVQSFVQWMTEDFAFSSNEVLINTAVLSFDLSVFEVMTFGGLGATILLNGNKSQSEPALLLSRIQKQKGSIWVSTPSFALIYSRMGTEPRLSSVNTFLFCGEVLPHGLAKDFIGNFSHARVLNSYGPTEATVATTLVEINEEILDRYDPLPVGKPKANCELIIEDGQITIIGPNVSKGYLNAPELNREKFSELNGKRSFKTGDSGYFEGDMLFFQGRNDDLVKLHGYRIELNEITAAILSLDYVIHADSIALRRNGIAKKIVSLAQLKKSSATQITSEDIKNELSKTLPSYMIPADIKFVDEIPLNQNGKTDKKVLTQLYLKK